MPYTDTEKREATEREEAAFKRGWEAATAAMVEAASNVRVPGTVNAVKNAPEPSGLVNELIAATNNRERVILALKTKPGMRPMEVIGFLGQLGAPINPQSVLTTIKRMRGDNVLHNRGAGLFLTPSKEPA